jgi:hypothetical protein
MNFKCPYCSKNLNLLELQFESDLMAIIKMQPVFGRHANLVWSYIDLFGITPMKAKTKKVRSLLEDIRMLFETGMFPYQKKRYRISQEGIVEAMNSMVRRNFETPLTNHNYLKTVMIPISERERQDAGRKAEIALRNREEQARLMGRHLSDEEIEANKARIRELIDKS